MGNLHLLESLPFSKKNEINTLVENRRAFTLNQFELNVFETYEKSLEVPLKFDDLVIVNMLKGKKVMHLKDVSAFDYSPGETLVLPAYSKMIIDFPEATSINPTQCTALSISQQKINDVINYVNEFYPKHHGTASWEFQLDKFHFYNSLELTEITNKLFQISLSQNMHKEALADLTLKELMIKIMQTQGLLVLQENTLTNRSLFDYLKDFIRNNISDKLTVEVLAKKVNMSKAGLFRIFKNEFGISPMEFIIAERINLAKFMLSQRKSVKETCFTAGFTDVNYFIRLFKKREGVTPGVYAGQYL
ncbi:helix-turn-helix domain-containing protein [Sphingobacterium hungaricum]